MGNACCNAAEADDFGSAWDEAFDQRDTRPCGSASYGEKVLVLPPPEELDAEVLRVLRDTDGVPSEPEMAERCNARLQLLADAATAWTQRQLAERRGPAASAFDTLESDDDEADIEKPTAAGLRVSAGAQPEPAIDACGRAAARRQSSNSSVMLPSSRAASTTRSFDVQHPHADGGAWEWGSPRSVASVRTHSWRSQFGNAPSCASDAPDARRQSWGDASLHSATPGNVGDDALSPANVGYATVRHVPRSAASPLTTLAAKLVRRADIAV